MQDGMLSCFSLYMSMWTTLQSLETKKNTQIIYTAFETSQEDRKLRFSKKYILLAGVNPDKIGKFKRVLIPNLELL